MDKLIRWSIHPLRLSLRYTWKISRNATDEKTNLIVSCGSDRHAGYGEAAPNIRYDETPERLLAQFQEILSGLEQSTESPQQLHELFERQGTAYALRFAIESAWLHHRHGGDRPSFQKQLNIPFRDKVLTSYTVPIMDPSLLRSFYHQERLGRFSSIKLKIDRDSGNDLLEELLACDPEKVLIDANEAFTDVEDCIRFLEKIRRLPVGLVEQPLPSRMRDEAIYLKKYSPFLLFADEAITHDADLEFIEKAYHGINMKLMKAGGYLKGMEILRNAKERGLQTMIGCMVETTLGISSAMNLCGLADHVDLDSFLLLKEEPYDLAREAEGELSFTHASHMDMTAACRPAEIRN
ncbi:MAG: enolase C-terminal domain-like protein [Bacteroidota bacterium]